MPEYDNSNVEESKNILSFEEALKRLRTPPEAFNALLMSGLLGFWTKKGVPLIGIEHFERYGTQWRPELGERLAVDLDVTFPQGIAGSHQPPSTHIRVQASLNKDLSIADRDTGWLVQFYLRANRFFFPDPGSLSLVGPLYLKLEQPRQVLGTKFPTYLYPDPTGSLAMVMVSGRNIEQHDDPLRIAYDIVVPILDELSIKYDQPLPIAHSIIVGVPSGVLTYDVSRHPKINIISATDPILPRCPYLELQDAIALYREGISSNNPFHQFLTLWKVYENTTRIRGNWRRQHKRNDIKVHQEIIPDVFAFRTIKGQNFDEVKQRYNDAYRNAIAHADISKSKPRTGALASDYFDVWSKVPVLRYMARIVLENVRATLSSTTTTENSGN